MTQRELARLANVSFSTVSKAFNNSDDISEETRNHIFKIAKQYGCYGEFFKGKYHKKVIAVICPEITSGYYVEFVKCLQSLIESDGNIAIISSDDFNSAKAEELIEYYASYMKVDGIIAFDMKGDLKKGYNTPIVSLFSSDSDKLDTVSVDFSDAVSQALSLLDGYGHKKIAFLSETLTKSKEELYKKAMNKIGNTNVEIIESKYRFEKAGEDSVRKLLSSDIKFTALMCAYDNIAIGAIKELKRSGLKVPEDVSVVGMDNINASEYTEASLTTIDSNIESVCASAWEILKEKIKSPYANKRKNAVINARLIVRKSVAMCRE